MTRDEAIARGIVPEETKHSMLRRSTWHDYSLKGTYMVTLVVDQRRPLFGTLKNDGASPYVALSPLGQAIRDEEVKKIHRYYPQVEVWKLCIMPDHLHLILRVKESLPSGKHLGQILAGFKGGCSKAALRLGATVPCASAQRKALSERSGNATEGKSERSGNEATGTAAPSASPEGKKSSLPVLFASGYNDKILLREGQLDCWKRYLDDNPRRLWVKRQNPKLFTVLSDLVVAGVRCQTVGNRFLLDLPDKVAVIVHRRYSEEEYRRLCEEWLDCGERGVCSSAPPSPRRRRSSCERRWSGATASSCFARTASRRCISRRARASTPAPAAGCSRLRRGSITWSSRRSPAVNVSHSTHWQNPSSPTRKSPFFCSPLGLHYLCLRKIGCTLTMLK